MFRKILRLLSQTLIVLLITFCLAEIVFRVYAHFHPSFIFYDPTYNRFRGKPNAPDYDFHLNSRGFKDVEFQTEKDANTYRILGLGDSFAFGVVPYRNNYLTLLEENLNQGGRKTEVINMGIVGTGPVDYLALLANEGVQLKPDMVLVSFFIGNDFLQEPVKRKAVSYSYVASLFYYLVVVNRAFEGQVIHDNLTYDDNAPTFSEKDFLSIEGERSDIYRKENKQFESDLSAAMSYLIQMKRICDDRQITLTVVLIPDEAQVNRALQARVIEAKHEAAAEFDFALPNRLLAAKLKEHNIDSLDLLDVFATQTARTNLYRLRDSHWNIAGNRLAADTIARDLFHLPPK